MAFKLKLGPAGKSDKPGKSTKSGSSEMAGAEGDSQLRVHPLLRVKSAGKSAVKPSASQTAFKTTPRDLLYGSGLTKKAADKAGTDQKVLQSRVYKNSTDASSDEALPAVLNLNIPSNLMDSDITLDASQQAAVEGAKEQRYVVINGRAGTGKTTVSNAVLHAVLPTISTIDLNSARMENNQYPEAVLNVSVCIVSFMGKAVQQIKRAVPFELRELCGTIHSTLAYCPEKMEYIDEETGEVKTKRVFNPQFNEHNKLPYELCIIDEGGSVPVSLFNNLVRALPENCRFIIMGDLNQLPPVSGHSILGFAIIKWPTFTLDTLHRNAGVIAENASRIIDGKKPTPNTSEFIIQDMPDSALESFQHAVATLQKLHNSNLFDPMRDAFIVPQNVDVLGQIAFNERLVRLFNPTKTLNSIPINPPIIITAGYVHATYAVGDKVMILSNKADLGLTNGMIGVITEILPNPKYKGEAIAQQTIADISSEDFQLDLSSLKEDIAAQKDSVEEAEETERQASHVVIVQFQNVDEPIDFSTAGAYALLTHAYAMTCHKAQGSEYDTVVILCHSANNRMLYREWLYTAVTRAKKRVILLCNKRGLVQAINKQMIKGKTIEEKAQKFISLSGKMQKKIPVEGKIDNSIPLLRNPKKV